VPVQKAGRYVNYPLALVMSDVPVVTPYAPKRWKNPFDANIIHAVNNYRAHFGRDQARYFDSIVEHNVFSNGTIFG